ncbi:hypothetical protein [Lactobacillus gasseri]|uniref:hypothetical protein n=1 Tax=Lactobacillus gasseri TaxID=1596 RepID=UPI00344C67F2
MKVGIIGASGMAGSAIYKLASQNKDLEVTGIDNHLVVEDIKKLTGSENWINTPKEQLNELNYLKQVEDVDWLGISPALTFEAGPEAAGYMLGNDTLLYNNNNESKVTSGTMARLVVNEIVHPEHHKERITLVDE